MKIVYSPKHICHAPEFELVNGKVEPHQEVPERIEGIIKYLSANFSFQVFSPQKFSIENIERVHAIDYLNYLIGLSASEDSLYPSVFNYSQRREISNNQITSRGNYFYDTYTPFLPQTYLAAREAVDCALTGADLIKTTEERVYYVCCRPPGHHALGDRAGGYCYFNNSAIAAEYLSAGDQRVAILDIDLHHGNGTQDIFYNRDDILTLSIHGHPNLIFPYFSGFNKERGQGRGEGFNYNFPLGQGIRIKEYLPPLRQSLSLIRDFNPDYLVVAVGFDTFELDPLSIFKLQVTDYQKISQLIKTLNLPTLIVQEGGYNLDFLPQCVESFLNSWL